MLHLTKKEQTVLTVVMLLLLTGLAVKSYRTAHPAKTQNDAAGAPTDRDRGPGAAATATTARVGDE